MSSPLCLFKRDIISGGFVVSLNEHHVFPAAYLFCPWLIDYWVHCCFQEGRVRVTLLARSTEYRRILNQVEVSPAAAAAPPSLLPSSVPLFLFASYFLFPPSTCPPLSFSFPLRLSPHSVRLCHSRSSSFPPLIYCPHLLSAYLKSYSP